MQMLIFLTIIISSVECRIREDPKGMYIEEGHVDTNILLAGFFGAHQHGKGGACSKIIDKANGVYLIEAMRYAINNINSASKIPYGRKMGHRIYDTCRSADRLRKQVDALARKYKYFTSAGPFVGAVGPPTTTEVRRSYVYFDLPDLPIISYSAKSVALSDKSEYRKFFSTIPDDSQQAGALLEIVKHFKWNFISTVNSHKYFEKGGMDLAIEDLKKEGICVSSRNVLHKKPTKQDFDYIVRDLSKEPIARIVVLFTTPEDTKMLLKSAGPNSKFQWLSSVAWDPNMQAIEGVKEAAKGAILLSYVNSSNKEFLNHFKGLTLNKNKYSWFEEFWEQQFNCTVKKNGNFTKKECTGNENLRESDFYADHAASQAVIDAVNEFAFAVRCFLDRHNGKKPHIPLGCYGPPAPHISGCEIRRSKEFKQALKKPNLCKDPFKLSLNFDPKTLRYHRDISILNFDGETYKTIGTWKSKAGTKKPILHINEKSIVWYNGSSTPPASTCSKPCKIGERKVMNKLIECCFTCEACGRKEILKNNVCMSCEKFSKPNVNRTSCENLHELRINTKNPFGVTIIVSSILGLILNTIVLFLFIRHKDSKIVKSSSRELSFFMLGGLYLCFISPFIFLMDPTTIRCGLRRFIFGISLTACYTPLVLKTNRIYRLFTAARVMVSMPPLVSARSQISICFGLLALQLFLCIMWVVGAPPVINRSVVLAGSNDEMVADLCGANIVTIVVNILPCFGMMAVSTVYAFKSRKFPKNYNEASIIGVTMYVSFVLWALFIPFLLLVKAQSSSPFAQTYVIANFTNVVGLLTLCGLFGPKIRRLFTADEKVVGVTLSNPYLRRECSCDSTISRTLPDEDAKEPGPKIDIGAVSSTEA
eukprot:Seg1854.3 transcript_id=Seg1854.3/GoldUCD/mRNA.D3Y31 product="Metabotropic glutamate receptor 8" protein_id=Seg1854.3/GoldUCD/D3Y31